MTASRRWRVRIAEPDDFTEEAVRILQAVADVTLQPCDSSSLADALAGCDVFWFRLGHQIREDVLPPRGSGCRVVASAVTGLDHIDLDACERRGIDVVSLRGEVDFLKNVRATAELSVGLAMALMRRIPAASLSVLRGGWDRDQFRGYELYGKTAGIVGMGRLGRLVAGYFRAFGMEVLGTDPRDDYPTEAAERVDLAELLERADVVSVHVALGPSTERLIGAPELAKMPPHAVVVNTSRGGIVDDEALLEALRAGGLAGAALDVIAGEPHIGIDHPLVRYARDHDNLLLVPHIGGCTHESLRNTEVFLANKVVEALARLD